MRRDVVMLWFATVLVVMATLPSRSAADLGCSMSGDPEVATCSIDADCAPVGGVACTSGFCLCNEGPLTPLCVCAQSLVHPAPLMSPGILILLIGGLTALAAFQLWRRSGARQSG